MSHTFFITASYALVLLGFGALVVDAARRHAALTRAFEDQERGARVGAILALVGIVNIPIVKFSVDWWNTLHQPASVTRLDAPGMHVDILYPLLTCALGFSLLFGAVVLARTRAAVMERRIRALQLARARREEAAGA